MTQINRATLLDNNRYNCYIDNMTTKEQIINWACALGFGLSIIGMIAIACH